MTELKDVSYSDIRSGIRDDFDKQQTVIGNPQPITNSEINQLLGGKTKKPRKPRQKKSIEEIKATRKAYYQKNKSKIAEKRKAYVESKKEKEKAMFSRLGIQARLPVKTGQKNINGSYAFTMADLKRDDVKNEPSLWYKEERKGLRVFKGKLIKPWYKKFKKVDGKRIKELNPEYNNIVEYKRDIDAYRKQIKAKRSMSKHYTKGSERKRSDEKVKKLKARSKKYVKKHSK